MLLNAQDGGLASASTAATRTIRLAARANDGFWTPGAPNSLPQGQSSECSRSVRRHGRVGPRRGDSAGRCARLQSQGGSHSPSSRASLHHHVGRQDCQTRDGDRGRHDRTDHRIRRRISRCRSARLLAFGVALEQPIRRVRRRRVEPVHTRRRALLIRSCACRSGDAGRDAFASPVVDFTCLHLLSPRSLEPSSRHLWACRCRADPESGTGGARNDVSGRTQRSRRFQVRGVPLPQTNSSN